MLFPNIEDYATREVVMLAETATLRQALARMVACGIRDVVVDGGSGGFGILTANDVIRLRCAGVDLDQAIGHAGFRPLAHVPKGDSILEALEYFGPGDEHVVVVDETGALYGIVSYSDVVTGIDPQVMIGRQRLADLLVRSEVKTLPADTPLGTVFAAMEEGSDAVVLLDGEAPAGILTTRDAARLIDGNVPVSAPARLHMSAPLHTVPIEFTIKEAIDYLKERGFKRLVVRGEEGRLRGIIRQRELVTIAYSRWAEMLRRHTVELREVVGLLERKAARLERLAITDKLTGVYNRVHFDKVAAAEMERFNRYGGSAFSLLLIDIDHFKAVNDAYGHLRGDEVLKHIAQVLNGSLRVADTLARWGGEEFAVLLSHTALEGAQMFAERIRAIIAATELAGPGRVTASIGVAEYAGGESLESLLARADTALYTAKRAGRDSVAVAPPRE